MNEAEHSSPAQSQPEQTRRGFSGVHVSLIIVLTVLATALLGWWLLRTYVFPTELQPVQLSVTERSELGGKLRQLGINAELDSSGSAPGADRAVPAPYAERPEQREVFLSERELNGLLARDPELGSRVAIDLADDLASLVVLIPVPPDFPVMPGRTLRVTAGAEISFRNGRPVVLLKGVSLMGVPLPNAWLGNLKNVDLVQEFGGDEGFWRSFAAGVDEVRVQDGQLYLRLRE